MIHSRFLCSQDSFEIHRHHDFQRMSGEPLYYTGKCVFCPWFFKSALEMTSEVSDTGHSAGSLQPSVCLVVNTLF